MADITTLIKDSEGKMRDLGLADLGSDVYAIKAKVEGISVQSVTATGVTIKDDPAGHKLKVESDGSLNVNIDKADEGLAELLTVLNGLLTKLNNVDTNVTAIKDIDGVKKINDVVNARVVGTCIVEQKTHEDADEDGIIEFADFVSTIEIYHESEEWEEFEINGFEIMIPPGGYRVCVGGVEDKEVVIPEIDCILWRLE